MSTTIDSPDPDVVYMRQAMTLASRGQGKVEPNPMVGCILVKKGRLIGQGYHRRFGGPHAEVYALRQAGPAARGATAYVTLEPCSHHGKTPPCADALIQAGVSRVVVAMKDPFPQVAGRGIRRLRRAGVKVSVGLCHEEAARLNAPYLTVLQRDRPYVILKWAQSLDGCIATRTGNSKWISSPLSRRWVHRLRARVDGILVGINTVLKDDPLLTARDVPIRRVATRIVLDTRLRLPARSQLVQTAAQIPLVVCTTGRALNQNTNRARRLERAGVHFLPCRTHKNRIALPDVLERLAKQKVTNLLVEGGGQVLGQFLDQNLADLAHIFVAPRFMGDKDAIRPTWSLKPANINQALNPAKCQVSRVGPDVLFRLSISQVNPPDQAD